MKDNPNPLSSIESAIQNAKPSLGPDVQAKLAYEAGLRAGASQGLGRSQAQYSLPWKVISLALAGCVVFLLVRSYWFESNPLNPVNQIVESDGPQNLGPISIEIEPFRPRGQTTVHWRNYSSASENPDDQDSLLKQEQWSPSLRPTNVNSLIDSI